MLPVNEHSFSKKGKLGKHTKERTGEALFLFLGLSNESDLFRQTQPHHLKMLNFMIYCIVD
jgi:hypothetical protein